MKSQLLILLAALALCLPCLAQNSTHKVYLDDQGTLVVDGDQKLEVGGFFLDHGRVQAGSLTLEDVTQLRYGRDGLRVFQKGVETMFLPADALNRSVPGLEVLQQLVEEEPR